MKGESDNVVKHISESLLVKKKKREADENTGLKEAEEKH